MTLENSFRFESTIHMTWDSCAFINSLFRHSTIELRLNRLSIENSEIGTFRGFSNKAVAILAIIFHRRFDAAHIDDHYENSFHSLIYRRLVLVRFFDEFRLSSRNIRRNLTRQLSNDCKRWCESDVCCSTLENLPCSIR